MEVYPTDCSPPEREQPINYLQPSFSPIWKRLKQLWQSRHVPLIPRPPITDRQPILQLAVKNMARTLGRLVSPLVKLVNAPLPTKIVNRPLGKTSTLGIRLLANLGYPFPVLAPNYNAGSTLEKCTLREIVAGLRKLSPKNVVPVPKLLVTRTGGLSLRQLFPSAPLPILRFPTE